MPEQTIYPVICETLFRGKNRYGDWKRRRHDKKRNLACDRNVLRGLRGENRKKPDGA
jgi:hypothetical protein